MDRPAKTLIYFVVSALLLVGIMTVISGQGGFIGKPIKTLRYDEVLTAIKDKKVANATWQQKTLSGELINGDKFTTLVQDADSEGGSQLRTLLTENQVPLKIEGAPASTAIIGFLSILGVPIMFAFLFYWFLIRPAQMGGNQAMNFGKSKARRVGDNLQKVTFEDVAGIEEAKQELFEIVDFLKNTKKYSALGAKIPKGILLTGPPGVGKTYLARAIAGEAGVPFFHISGSDFVEMFVGVGAARVRDLFETAKAHRPSLIFVDEIDAVGRQRGAGLGGGHDEREQTLNQLLVEMDGFDPNSGVIMIAATNRPDVLDPALLRPGRFDRTIVVDGPDQHGRAQILKVHSKGKPFEPDVDFDVLAKRTPGFTGADLANMLNEAALLTARRNKAKIGQSELEEALDRTIAGPERKSRVIDPKERETIAYHEAGHAIVGEVLEYADPVHKVTILPRGMSLGSTWHLPDTDRYLISNDELMDDITALLGGRVAEEIIYNRTTTGASNDLQRVTTIARAMVCEYGMSDKLGTLALGRRHSNPFLGRDYSEDRNYSEEVAKMIDEEVRHIVELCHQRATELLTSHRVQLDAVVKELLAHETLDREEFLLVMKGESLPEKDTSVSAPQNTSGGEVTAPPTIAPPRLEPGPA